jgi:polyribonucleotide nucleotidyltransferase
MTVYDGHAPHEPDDRRAQRLNDTKRYLHHYNMPPWANGETGRVGSPKRREIGHGALAAVAPSCPSFPTRKTSPTRLRLVSEVMSSNGSTSMGSVCASSLALMDAGVPIKASRCRYRHGPDLRRWQVHHPDRHPRAEDAFGDMDFKVAGTADIITALQLDTKIDGIPVRRVDRSVGAGQSGPPRDPRGDERLRSRESRERSC